MLNVNNIKIIISAVDKASAQMKKIGRGMTLGLTLPLLGVAAASVKAGADFDNSMTKSLAIMKTTIEQQEEMARVARDTAKTTAFSHTQVADSYFYLASAGLDAAAAMAAIPAVAEFAQAGAFDLALATDLLTDAQSALGLAIRDDAVANMKNMIKVSDVLVKANTLANATVEQFSSALTTEAGAALKSFGIDMEEGVAVLAAFADQGVKGQVAGSGLSRILRLLTKAANSNQEEMDKLGITVFDTNGEIRNMADIIEDLENALGGMSDKQRTVALESIGFTARVQGIILPLLGTSAAIRDYEKALRDAGGTTKMVSEKQLESFTNQMAMVKSQLVDVGITIGNILMPIVLKLSKSITDVVAKFQEFSPAVQKTILIVLGLVAALGPVLMILGQMMPVFMEMPLIILKVKAAWAILTSALGLFTIAASVAIIQIGRVIMELDDFGNEVGGMGNAWKMTMLSMKEEVLKFSITAIEAYNKVAKYIPGVNKVVSLSLDGLKNELAGTRLEFNKMALAGYESGAKMEEMSKIEKALTEITADLEGGMEDLGDTMEDSFKEGITTIKEIRDEIKGAYDDLGKINEDYQGQFR